MPENPALMQALLQLLAPQQQPAQPQGGGLAGLIQQLRNDPQGDRNKAWTSVGPGGGFDQAKSAGFFGPAVTPQAGLASQGASATNQWGQLGQVEGIDPFSLSALMGQMHNNPTGMPDPGHVIPSEHWQNPTPEGVSRISNIEGGMSLIGMNPATGESGTEMGVSLPYGGHATKPQTGQYDFPAGGATSFTPQRGRGGMVDLLPAPGYEGPPPNSVEMPGNSIYPMSDYNGRVAPKLARNPAGRKKPAGFGGRPQSFGFGGLLR